MTESKKRLGKLTKFDLSSLFVLISAGGILINHQPILGISSEFYTLIITVGLTFTRIIMQSKQEEIDEEKIKKLVKDTIEKLKTK